MNKAISGISSGTTCYNLQNVKTVAAIGGIDYPLKFPKNPIVIKQWCYWGITFSESLHKTLSLLEETTKNIAKSKVKDSQYGTDVDKLKFPLSGVTYLELKSLEEKLEEKINLCTFKIWEFSLFKI